MDGFTTVRLSVRDWAPDLADSQRRADLEEILTNVLSPNVLRYLPDPLRPTETENAISDWMNARAAESDVYLVSSSVSRDLFGLLILAFDDHSPDQKDCHVGYLLAEHAWGNGYATELLIGLVAALKKDGPMTIIGGVDIDNSGSARVLEKAGFIRNTKLSDSETSMYTLQIDRGFGRA